MINMATNYHRLCVLWLLASFQYLNLAYAAEGVLIDSEPAAKTIEVATLGDPENIYSSLKQYLTEQNETGIKIKIPGAGRLTIQQLMGACKSIDGDCDLTELGHLDDEIYLSDKQFNWVSYRDYCRKRWLQSCDAHGELKKQRDATFTNDQWQEARKLVSFVLDEPDRQSVLNVRHGYPTAMVKYMQSRDDKLVEILEQKKDKKSLFEQKFKQLVRPVCEQVVSNLKYHVMAISWFYDNSVPLEELEPKVQSALKVFRVCQKISVDEDELISYSYRIFCGKKISDGGFANKLKKVALSSLGVKDK